MINGYIIFNAEKVFTDEELISVVQNRETVTKTASSNIIRYLEELYEVNKTIYFNFKIGATLYSTSNTSIFNAPCNVKSHIYSLPDTNLLQFTFVFAYGITTSIITLKLDCIRNTISLEVSD